MPNAPTAAAALALGADAASEERGRQIVAAGSQRPVEGFAAAPACPFLAVSNRLRSHLLAPAPASH
jgi:hypothetical protein